MLEHIKTLSEGGQSSKSAIATFLLKHLATIEDYSLEELASQTYTSKSSLVRFAQLLGYKGWTDFLPALLSARYYSRSHFSDIDHSLPFSQDDDNATIIQKIATIEQESIQDTADRMDLVPLQKSSDYLHAKNRVVVFGVSPNEYLAHLFKRKMMAIGKAVEVAHPNEFGLYATTLTPNDLAIIISYSGNSEQLESLKHLPLLKKNKVAIIALTSSEGHYLSSQADACFTICTREDKHRKIGNFSTEESILFILNTLYSVYLKRDYFSNYVTKITLAEDLEKDR